MKYSFNLRYTSILVIVYLANTASIAQSLEDELFYVHLQHKLFEIKFLSKEYKIACSPNSIYLLDGRNIIVDSVNNNKIVQNILVFNSELFSVSYVKESNMYRLENGKLKKIKSFEYDERFGIPFFTLTIGGVIGYLPAVKPKRGYSLVYIPLSDGRLNLKEQFSIISEPKILTSFNKSDRFPTDFYWENGYLIINYPEINTLILFNPIEKEVKKITYPNFNNAKDLSYYTFFDHLSSNYYTIQYSKKEKNTLYRLDMNSIQFAKLNTVIDGLNIKGFLNNKIYYTIGTSHYLKSVNYEDK